MLLSFSHCRVEGAGAGEGEGEGVGVEGVVIHCRILHEEEVSVTGVEDSFPSSV